MLLKIQWVLPIFLPCLLFNLTILCINPFPTPSQAVSLANLPTLEVFEANHFEIVKSKRWLMNHKTGSGPPNASVFALRLPPRRRLTWRDKVPLLRLPSPWCTWTLLSVGAIQELAPFSPLFATQFCTDPLASPVPREPCPLIILSYCCPLPLPTRMWCTRFLLSSGDIPDVLQWPGLARDAGGRGPPVSWRQGGGTMAKSATENATEIYYEMAPFHTLHCKFVQMMISKGFSVAFFMFLWHIFAIEWPTADYSGYQLKGQLQRVANELRVSRNSFPKRT